MKKIKLTFIAICFTLFYNKTYSQNSGELIYVSKNKLNNYLEEKYVLNFNNNISLFTLLEREVKDKISTNEFKNEITISNKYPDSLTPKYFINTAKNEISFSKPVSHDDFKTFLNYHIKENLKLDWLIHDDTISISNIKCQKASLKFRGRSYIAWFSTEHNLPYGPFKFYGLPGIIVLIEDNLKEVSFMLKTIKFGSNDVSTSFNEFKKNSFISLKDFNKIQSKAVKNSQDDFIRSVQSKLGRGATIEALKTQNYNIELNFDDIE